MTPPLQGRCLCGAVTVTVTHPTGEFSGCHCDNCRRWSGSLFLGMEFAATDVTLNGPIKVHQSTPFSERAWCDTCGSHVFLRDNGSDRIELMPGLFDNFSGARLTRIVYADRCPDGLIIGGDVERTTKADYEAHHLHQEAAS